MPRHEFGVGVADWTFQPQVGTDLAQLVGGVQVTFYSAETGGIQYTDLSLDLEGTTPIANGIVVSADGTGSRAKGTIPPFFGPNDVWVMWAQAGSGPRARLISYDFGPAIAQAAADILNTNATLAAHAALLNAHGTGLGDLADANVGTAASRTNGHLVGWDAASQRYVMLSPSQAGGAVLLDPPLVAGDYVGNIAQPPLASQGSSGDPWLRLQQPHSAGDNNPDGIQFFSTLSGGGPVKTAWFNGNMEFRGAPSTNNRIGGRFFEFAEGSGGPSTDRFFEVSTNPTIVANREALLGAYGTGHATKPGWIVATRVLEGLTGVRAGGSYNGLSSVNLRGLRASSGPPTTGTWIAGDAVVDSRGQVWLCTVGGTPGTWHGGSPAAVALTMQNGATSVNAGYRLVNGDGTVELAGRIANNTAGNFAAGTVIANLPLGARPPFQVKTGVRFSGGGQTMTVETNGDLSINGTVNIGQEVFLDGQSFVRTWI